MVWRLILSVLAAVAIAIGISIHLPTDPVLNRTNQYVRHFHWSAHFPFLTTYLLYSPQECTSTNRCPLIVALHGGHKRSLAAYFGAGAYRQSRQKMFVLMPMAPFGRPWAIPPGAEATLGTSEALPSAMEIVGHVVAEKPIDEDRIYVTGSSIGGVGTFAAMVRHRDLFAAGVAVNGVWPLEQAHELKTARVAVFHGTDDPFFAHIQNLIVRLDAIGGSPKFIQMPDVGHGSQPAYRDDRLWNWLLAQRL